jgi:hypothetical protein
LVDTSISVDADSGMESTPQVGVFNFAVGNLSSDIDIFRITRIFESLATSMVFFPLNDKQIDVDPADCVFYS